MSHFLKSDIALSTYQRRNPSSPSLNWPDHVVYIVRSNGDLEDAMNEIHRTMDYSVIILDGDIFQLPNKGWFYGGSWQEMIFHGGRDSTRIVGSSGQLLGTSKSGRIGISNAIFDGREGVTQKGIVCGSANGESDGRRGPVTDIWLDHVLITGVEQQLFMFMDDSYRLNINDVDLTNNGHGMGPDDHAEGAYIGKVDGNRHTHSIEITGLYTKDVHGESLDMKVNATDLKMQWFEFTDTTIPYSGALTLCIDNNDGSHGLDNNFDISHGLIDGVVSRKYSISAIQAGAGGKIGNIITRNVQGGRMLQTLRQAKGPSKQLEITGPIVSVDQGGYFEENQSTLSDKSKATSPMTIKNKNLLKVNSGMSATAMREVIIGSNGEIVPDLPPIVIPAPIAVQPVPVDPQPETPEPAPAVPEDIPAPIEVDVKIGIKYDLTELDEAIARLQKIRDDLSS